MATKQVFLTLDGIRGVAALAVVLFHATPLFGLKVAPNGYLAVDLFFALSGFVIAHAYNDRLASGMSWREFLGVRLVRFYPLYILGLLVGVAVAILTTLSGTPDSFTFPTILSLATLALFFVPAPNAGDMFPLNMPSWSLFYEVLVNAAYALFFPWLSVRVLVGVAIVSLLGVAAGVWWHGGNAAGPMSSHALIGVCRTLFSFSVGLLLYEWRRPSGVSPFITVGLVGLLLAVPVSASLRPFFDVVCVALLFPLAVALGAGAEPTKLQWMFRYLGRISFPMYALHFPLILLARMACESLDFPTWPSGLLVIAGLLFACPLIDARYDRPIRSWLSSRKRRIKSAAAGAA
jgi:peptidoglycan/LPS O-acetylase OafA/YrhL